MAEGWPMLEVFFIWTFALGAYALACSGLMPRPAGLPTQVDS